MTATGTTITRSGRAIALLGVVSYALGWQFGWTELMVTAAACGLALAAAVGFVLGRLRIDIERRLEADRVMAGTPTRSVLTVTNPGRRSIGPRRLEERGTHTAVIELDGLAGREGRTITTTIDTDRRGIVEVGPAVLTKTDPFTLLRREMGQTGVSRLVVHPRHVAVAPLPVGFAKDLDGPTSDTSPAGDVSFHTVREYAIGDDHRHVHWLSTARTGVLMVRQYVDNRRPHVTVVLDDRIVGEHERDGYELAVEVVASLAVSTLMAGQPLGLRLGDRPVPATVDAVLDALTTVEPEGVELLDATTRALAAEPDTSVVVIVTGDRSPAELTAVATGARRHAHVVIVRCGRMEPVAVPGADTHTVASLDAFAVAWNRSTR